METYNDTESFWSEMYEGLPPPSSSPPVPAMAAMERQSTPWETLQAFEDERLSTNSSVMRVSLYGPFYAHLPNVYLDWELESYVYRVLGSKCYGLKLPKPSVLQQHIQSPYHMKYNEMQAPRQQTPPPLTNYVRQNTEAAPKEATTPSRQYMPTEIEDSQAEDLWTASPTSIRQNTEATPNEATAPVGPLDSQDIPAVIEILDSQDIPTFIELPNSQTEDLWSETSTPVHQNIEPTPHEATTPVHILDGRYTPTIIEIPDSQAEDL
ncbi:hypothetical protein T069G_06501 [Trichoderma breve]|uniref:Uncharacterized protein n=1 Tax=Trichoderma breve TaxID=2034170 RepID=A0A9W9BBE2_9HYPO|nr:hypothetical protein T069G_06501 [Trichoderma breve]KAJ4858234.1 hypothetical protein T069G_06501 [Trichoderma breve]